VAEKKLFEGFVKSAGQAVRSFFARSSEQSAQDLRRGGIPSVEKAGLPFTQASNYGYNELAETLRVDQQLQAAQTDYEEMDQYPEIQVALDLYADDTCTPNLDREEAIWVESKDKAVAEDLNDMLHKNLGIEDDIWAASRTLCKYGDSFGEILVADEGVVGINYLPPPTMRRVESRRGLLLGFVQDMSGGFNLTMEDFYALAAERSGGPSPALQKSFLSDGRTSSQGITVFEDWEVVHWRLRGKHPNSVYGSAVIDPARWVWKRLSLLEDALLIYKLERAPARYAFYVDIGGLDAERGLAHVNRVKNQFARKKFVNSSGQLDMRNNPLAHDEDFFIGVRDGKRTTEIDVIQGPDYTEIESLNYHRDKLVAALKIPQIYMGYGGEAVQGQLSTQDIRFARSVMRIQRVIRGGYRKVCRVHLIATNKDPERADYQVKMAVPSSILELARMEVMNTVADLASRMGEFVSAKWLLVHLFRFSEDEALQVMDEKRQETLANAAIDAQAQKLLQSLSDDELSAGSPELTEMQQMEMRLSKLIKAVPRNDWRRNFDHGSRRDEYRWKDKLDKVLKEQAGFRKRFMEVAPMMHELRSMMRDQGAV